MRRTWFLVLMGLMSGGLEAVHNKGFLNKSRTDCFINATIQALAHLKVFQHFLHHDKSYSLVQDYFKQLDESSVALDPQNFRKAISVHDTCGVDFKEGQQDAQEFLDKFLTLLRQKVSGDTEKNLGAIFDIYIKSSAGVTIKRTLSLLVKDDIGEQNLEGLLKEHSKNNSITKFPQALIVQLDRLHDDHKNMNQVRFPQRLSFKESDPIYRLVAVIIHAGNIVDERVSGHYYTYALDTVGEHATNKWYKFNDNIVTEITKNTKEDFDTINQGFVWGEGTPYLLFYEQVNDNDAVEPLTNEEFAQFGKVFLGQPQLNHGCENAGSDCFINAPCQALYHLPSFRRFLVEAPNGRMIALLKKHFFSMHENEKPLSITSFRNSLCDVLHLSDREDPNDDRKRSERQKWRTNQQDAREFIESLLVNFGEELVPQDTKLNQLVGITISRQVSHLLVNGTTHQGHPLHEISRILSVPIAGDTLKDCLTHDFKPELIEDFQCDFCPKDAQDRYIPVEAERTQKIIATSPLLIIQLQRFHTLADGSLRKMLHPVSIPENLDISNERGSSSYQLRAFVVHRGTMIFGHYWAYVRIGNKWYCYNDDDVSEISNCNLLQILNPPHVVNELKRVTSKFPTVLKVLEVLDGQQLPENIEGELKKAIRTAQKLGPSDSSEIIEEVKEIIGNYEAPPYLLFYERVVAGDAPSISLSTTDGTSPPVSKKSRAESLIRTRGPLVEELKELQRQLIGIRKNIVLLNDQLETLKKKLQPLDRKRK